MDYAGATPQPWQDKCDFIGWPGTAESSQGAIHQPQIMEGEGDVIALGTGRERMGLFFYPFRVGVGQLLCGGGGNTGIQS